MRLRNTSPADIKALKRYPFWVVVVASDAKGRYQVTCSRGRNCRNEENQWFGFRILSFQVDAFKSIFYVSEKKKVLSPTWPLAPGSKR